MAMYIISYDLNSPGQRYSELHDEIKSLGAWWHHLTSTWLVDTTLSASQIRDRLKAKVDANDKILVLRAGATWATFGMPKSANDWLNQHV
jgi:hypothetical protein